MDDLPNLDLEFLKNLGNARHLSKRIEGISMTRTDGSRRDPETDRQSIAAEYWAARSFGCPFNATIGPDGDGGPDFRMPLNVEVIWFGYEKKKIPRTDIHEHLIVRTDQPWRWADLYVLVGGSIETGFKLLGWTWHNFLITLPRKSFSGVDCYAAKVDQLMRFDLMDIRRFRRDHKERARPIFYRG